MLARGTSAASEGQCMKRRLAIMKAARGNVELSITIVTRSRSIPARAGETAEVVFC